MRRITNLTRGARLWGLRRMSCPLELPPTGANLADRQRHLTAHSPPNDAEWRHAATAHERPYIHEPWAPQPQGAGSIPVPPASRTLNSCGLQPHSMWPNLRVLTPFDPNGSNTGSRVSDAQLVIDVLPHQDL